MRYVTIPAGTAHFTFASFIEAAVLRAPHWADEWADDWDEWGKDVIPALIAAKEGDSVSLQDHEHEKIAHLVKIATVTDPKVYTSMMPLKHAVTRAAREDPNKALPAE